MRHSYLKFVSALALVGGAASASGCAASSGSDAGDIVVSDFSTGQPCTLEGQSCDPLDAGNVNCCRCITVSDASADGAGDDSGTPPVGRWQGYCIGPLSPPDIAV